jgi:hypothetical protein
MGVVNLQFAGRRRRQAGNGNSRGAGSTVGEHRRLELVVVLDDFDTVSIACAGWVPEERSRDNLNVLAGTIHSAKLHESLMARLCVLNARFERLSVADPGRAGYSGVM